VVLIVRVAIGSDHAGFILKEEIKSHLSKSGIEFEDFGTHSQKSCDYPLIAQTVAGAVANGQFRFGILVCGTGIGVSISANKVSGIRAALCHDTFSARMTRMHNDANVLTLGARVIGAGLALDIVDIFLKTDFEGGRHTRRVEQICQLDKNRC